MLSHSLIIFNNFSSTSNSLLAPILIASYFSISSIRSNAIIFLKLVPALGVRSKLRIEDISIQCRFFRDGLHIHITRGINRNLFSLPLTRIFDPLHRVHKQDKILQLLHEHFEFGRSDQIDYIIRYMSRILANMSNIYIQEPPTTGKVMMKTTVGDIDLELWTKEAPKACRNFIQLCMEGYYDNTIFHRIIKGFIAQGGDPTGTGDGGESIYGQPFKDEFHTRLRFCRRGLLAMANADKDDNASQFFFTLGSTPELQNKHTIFGKVTGETVYNMLKLEEALVDEDDRPLYPPTILKTEILNNPFVDIVPRVTTKKSDETKEVRQNKKTGVKNFSLLSFGEEAEEDEEESVILNKQFSGKGKSAHDHLTDPKLSTQLAVEPAGPPSKKKREDRSSDWESEDDDRTPEELESMKREKEAMKQRIKNKLQDTKKEATKAESYKVNDDEDDTKEDEYYLGKDRDDERKRKAEEIRKEIRDLKRGVQNEKKAKEADKKIQQEQEEKKEKKTEIMKQYIETQVKYKEAKSKIPKKGKSREDFTMELLNKFKSKLHTAKETVGERSPSPPRTEDKKDDDFDPADESWMVHTLQCEEKAPILAKDASTKDDDWFEIYDPRNPLNKRRRGEKSQKLKEEGSRRPDSHRK